MPTPSTPYVISGTVTKSNGLVSPNSIITFTTASGTATYTTKPDGKYVYDLANLGYTSGETLTYSVVDENKNEVYSGTHEIVGDYADIDIALSLRSDRVFTTHNRGVQIFRVGGEMVSEGNPLPVTLVNTADIIDLTNNPNTSWVITRVDLQPDSETITIKGVSYTRSFTYSSSGAMITRSKWVRV